MEKHASEKHREASRTLDWNVRPLIGGTHRDSSSEERVSNVNPATGELLCSFGAGTSADVDEAVASARAVHDAGHWSCASPMHRKAVLYRYCELLERYADELALFDTLEMGKPLSQSEMEASSIAPAYARYCVESIDKIYGYTARGDMPSLCFTELESRGVVGAIVPWNFPTVNAAIKIFPALAAGNAVVLKPSEVAPSSASRIAELALEAGLPEGVLNVVPGLGGTVGAALARHGDVDFISFTGSTATGRALMRLSADSNGKPLMLECGGKSPCVVFADVGDDLENVAQRIVAEALWNQGQVCVARSRIIVEQTIAERLIEHIVEAARQYRPGDPLDPETMLGPLASEAQADRVMALVAAGLSEGGRLLHGGRRAPPGAGHCHVEATVLGGVTPGMRVWREEIFGPVITLSSFASKEEALRLANDTPYGLAATIWTRNLVTARYMIRGLRTGEVIVRANAVECEGSAFALPQEPRGASGFGVETGVDGLKSYMTMKKVEVHAA